MRLRRPTAAFVVAAIVTITSGSCASAVASSPPVMTPAGVRFVLVRPDARTVAVVGSFNEWSVSSHPLTREKPGGRWSVVVALAPGEHVFMFVVDGTEWVTPPLAEDYVDDGFGAKNGIVVVRSAER